MEDRRLLHYGFVSAYDSTDKCDGEGDDESWWKGGPVTMRAGGLNYLVANKMALALPSPSKLRKKYCRGSKTTTQKPMSRTHAQYVQ